MKSNVTLSIDSDVLRKVKEKRDFNLSGFVEQKLRELVEAKELL